MSEKEIKRTKQLIALHTKTNKGKALLKELPQGHGSSLDSDTVDGLHAVEIIAKGQAAGGGGGGGGGNGGDMLKAVYDTNNNGIVDNSEKLEGSTKSEVQDHPPKIHGDAAHSETYIKDGDPIHCQIRNSEDSEWINEPWKRDVDVKNFPSNYPLPSAQVTDLKTITNLLDPHPVSQATRTSLKAQTEREDIISLGGVVSPNNAGVQIIAGTEGQKIKVYDAEYEAGADGLHYFYFGTTTPTTKRFLSGNTKGKNSKTFVQPRIGADGDSLYLYSAISETDMPYDVGYVKE